MTTLDGREGSGGTWETSQAAEARRTSTAATAVRAVIEGVRRRAWVMSHSRHLFLLIGGLFSMDKAHQERLLLRRLGQRVPRPEDDADRRRLQGFGSRGLEFVRGEGLFDVGLGDLGAGQDRRARTGRNVRDDVMDPCLLYTSDAADE